MLVEIGINLDIHIGALGVYYVGIASECLVVIGLLHVANRVLADLRLVSLEFGLIFVCNLIHLVLKGHLAVVHIHVHVVKC